MFENYSKEQIFKLNRRQFVKYCAALATTMGITFSGEEISSAIEEASEKPPVIWFEAQGCGGCLASMINSAAPSFGSVILDLLSIKYQPELSFDSDNKAVSAIDQVVQSGKHVLIVSGAVSTADDGAYCRILKDKSGKILSAKDAIQLAGKKASAVLAVGTCSSFGGITSAFEQFRVMELKTILPSKQVINIPGCPPHPDWVLGTILNMLLYGRTPEIDKLGRPNMFFSQSVHDNCPRRGNFEKGEFAVTLGESDKCFYKLGCKGPDTFADCPKRKWNDNVNWCVQANSVCIGCANPRFYNGLSPLSSVLPEVSVPVFGRQQVDDIGKVGVAATVVGIGAHFGWKTWQKYRVEKAGGIIKFDDKEIETKSDPEEK
jgi:hydrogenase small subunit